MRFRVFSVVVILLFLSAPLIAKDKDGEPFQSTYAASIVPGVTGGGTAFTIEIDDIPDDMRFVVESVSLSLRECDDGLVESAHIRDYSNNTYMMLPLLNNYRSAKSGICGTPPGVSNAFYQSNHFSTTFYLANEIRRGGPVIVVSVDQDLEPVSLGTIFVTLSGYLESYISP